MSRLVRREAGEAEAGPGSLEMQREWSALSQLGELTMYGYPFGDQPVLPSAAGGLIPSFIPVIGSKSVPP